MILISGNHRKPQLSKFCQLHGEDTQRQSIRDTFRLVSKRDESVCNFLKGGLLIEESDNRPIERHDAMLYFVFYVDFSDSELGIEDIIQAGLMGAAVPAVSAVKNVNLPEIPKKYFVTSV
ncbi:AP-3 complex subunit sigma-1-like [Pteronotus mesoamericanus]|uniref:AP-3 complex subunit sigma-1-like n=1 Tax=Pteronotus mesoamericanus TaxID=1884717 RepID=UPI0023EBC536|nr:AP-3 complex subunit sigma-1-like [Pteronotus parnellii mesoamericanus]